MNLICMNACLDGIPTTLKSCREATKQSQPDRLLALAESIEKRWGLDVEIDLDDPLCPWIAVAFFGSCIVINMKLDRQIVDAIGPLYEVEWPIEEEWDTDLLLRIAGVVDML
jgi:hypothetical protein